MLDLQLDPDLREELFDANEDVNNLNAIAKMLSSNGGKLMIGHILDDAKQCLEWILENYKSANHAELVANIADLGAILRFYNTIKTAQEDSADAEQMLEKRLNELIE